jgi:hypothetical protein
VLAPLTRRCPLPHTAVLPLLLLPLLLLLLLLVPTCRLLAQ